MSFTQSTLETNLIDLKYLNEFLIFFFKYHDKKTNRLVVDKEILKEFKQYHEKVHTEICSINSLDALTLKNFLFVLIDVFFYIEMYYISKRDSDTDTRAFYEYFKLILKDNFMVNESQIPINDLYDLLNLELKVFEKIKPLGIKNSKGKKSEELSNDNLYELASEISEKNKPTLTQTFKIDTKYKTQRLDAPINETVNYKQEYPKFFYSQSKLNYYPGYHNHPYQNYAHSLNNLNGYYNNFFNIMPLVK